MSEKLRWRIADLANRFKRTCWSDLVTWALDWHTPGATLRWASRPNRSCRRDAAQTGACYCGKVSTYAAQDGWPHPPHSTVVLDQDAVRRIRDGA